MLNPEIKKGAWTPTEDELLQASLAIYGPGKWSRIAQSVPGRNGKQCRERWHNHLMPNVKKDPWSREEDDLIMSLRMNLGNRWAEIARQLPGRTENAVKNRWNAKLSQESKGRKPKPDAVARAVRNLAKANEAAAVRVKKENGSPARKKGARMGTRGVKRTYNRAVPSRASSRRSQPITNPASALMAPIPSLASIDQSLLQAGAKAKTSPSYLGEPSFARKRSADSDSSSSDEESPRFKKTKTNTMGMMVNPGDFIKSKTISNLQRSESVHSDTSELEWFAGLVSAAEQLELPVPTA